MRAIAEGMRWFLRSSLRWAILALLIVAFLWFVPQLQGEYFSHKVPVEERPALVNEYRRTWAQIIGGFGFLLGLYFTWRRVEISQDQQVTERFTRAIDQLGATHEDGEPRLEVRLGGIYALERIALDSPKRDYSTVMEVLTAYVRENTRQAPGFSKDSSDAASTSNEAPAEAGEGAKQPDPPEPRRPTADIQAIVDVLIRTKARVSKEYRTRFDLHRANLQGALLRGANLQEAILPGANLQEANLEGALLQGAILVGANLGGTFLAGANLKGAVLQGANLQRANLKVLQVEAILQEEANPKEAILEGAKLQRANLKGATVTDEQLANTLSLQGATMPDGQTLRDKFFPNRPTFEDWLKDTQRQRRQWEEARRERISPGPEDLPWEEP